MAEYKNYYRILGVPVDADEKKIKCAYRRLVKRWHPDLNNNSKESQEKLKEINEAYDILSDSVARATYNQTIYTQPNESFKSKKTEEERRAEEARKTKVKQKYEQRTEDTQKYYSEFERILNEHKNDRCDSGLWDKYNIFYSDTRDLPVFMRFYAMPMFFIFAIVWHGSELFGRGIEYIISLFENKKEI